MPSSNSSLNKNNKKEAQNTWQIKFFKKPGTCPGAFIGMILGLYSGLYPCLKGGFELIPLLVKTFPNLNSDIAYCIGLAVSCTTDTICYGVGFALGALIGHELGKCCSVSSLEKEIENDTIKNNTPYTKS